MSCRGYSKGKSSKRGGVRKVYGEQERKLEKYTGSERGRNPADGRCGGPRGWWREVRGLSVSKIHFDEVVNGGWES